MWQKKKKKTPKTNKWIEQDLGYKVNIQNSTLFQCTVSEHMDPEKKKNTIYFAQNCSFVVV